MASKPSNDNAHKDLPLYDSSDVTFIEVVGPGDTTVRPIDPNLLKWLPPGPWSDQQVPAGNSDQDNPRQAESDPGDTDQ